MKSAGLYDFLRLVGWFCIVLFEDNNSELKQQRLFFDGVSSQETVGQHFYMNCSKIGHSYEAFTCLFCQNIFIHLDSANKQSYVYLWK